MPIVGNNILRKEYKNIFIFFANLFQLLYGIFFMPFAYVLVNCELGKEEQVIQKLHGIDSIKEINGTFGSFDVIAKIETSSVEQLNDIISKQIRSFEKINGTLTLMGIDGQD